MNAEGSGWHRESRRHHDAAMQGKRPRSSGATGSAAPAETRYQEEYLQKFLKFEQEDLKRNIAEYTTLIEKDPYNDRQIELCDLIDEGGARVEMLEKVVKLPKEKRMSNAQFSKELHDLAERYMKESKQRRGEAARHKLEWQAYALYMICPEINEGKAFK